jgi:2-polyprenyl-6-hydroxyphenyl methylase/3-demethylubiquinone-9 3-methyltransferase
MNLEEARIFWDSNYFQEEKTKSYLPLYGKKFYERLKNMSGNVLDAGCSDLGCFPEEIKVQDDINLTGLDISKIALSRAVRRNKGFKNIDMTLGVAQNLPFKEESFDNVICIETIKHTGNDYKQVLEELGRVLKKEGRMILTFQHKDYTEKSGFIIKGNLAVDLRYLSSASVFDEHEVKKLIEDQGLVIKEMEIYTTKDLEVKGFPQETKDIIYVECKKG